MLPRHGFFSHSCFNTSALGCVLQSLIRGPYATFSFSFSVLQEIVHLMIEGIWDLLFFQVALRTMRKGSAVGRGLGVLGLQGGVTGPVSTESRAGWHEDKPWAVWELLQRAVAARAPLLSRVVQVNGRKTRVRSGGSHGGWVLLNQAGVRSGLLNMWASCFVVVPWGTAEGSVQAMAWADTHLKGQCEWCVECRLLDGLEAGVKAAVGQEERGASTRSVRTCQIWVYTLKVELTRYVDWMSPRRWDGQTAALGWVTERMPQNRVVWGWDALSQVSAAGGLLVHMRSLNNGEQAAELGEELGLESPVGRSDPLSVPPPWLRVCALRTRPINRRLHPLTSCGFTTEGAGETGQSEEGVLNPRSPSYGVEAGASPGWPFLSGNSPRPAVVSWPPDTGLTGPCGSHQPNHKCTQYSHHETALHWYFRVCGFLPGPWLIQGRWES